MRNFARVIRRYFWRHIRAAMRHRKPYVAAVIITLCLIAIRHYEHTAVMVIWLDAFARAVVGED